MGRKATLGMASNGQFCRNLGYLQSGGQPKFLLGKDEDQAGLRNAKLELLWKIVAEGQAGRPFWDIPSLNIAKAFSGGKPVLSGGNIVNEITSKQQLIQVIRQGFDVVEISEAITRLEEELAEVNECSSIIGQGLHQIGQGLAQRREELDRLDEALGNPKSQQKVKQTTHEALELFRQHLTEENTSDGQISAYGKVAQSRIKFLLRIMPNVDLSVFDLEAVEKLENTIAKRPEALTHHKQGKKPISKAFAREVMKLFRNFIRWAHRAKSVKWRKPEDYEVRKVRFRVTDEEKMATPFQVSVADLDEVKTLWEYATPTQRLYILLALNCGAGSMEVATLQQSHLLLHAANPYAERFNIFATDKDSWLIRGRRKTGASGMWKLWDVTVKAIEWYQTKRPDDPKPELILSKNGRTLHQQTKSGNPCQHIANEWNYLLNRIQKDKPKFPRYSFNKLRKTSTNLIRQEGGDEIATLFVFHGKSKVDPLLENYANKPYGKLQGAIWGLGNKLKPIFESVEDPFPDHFTQGNKVSRGQIIKINELAKEKKTIRAIARELKLSQQTVKKYIK